jgi:hypothetical protein
VGRKKMKMNKRWCRASVSLGQIVLVLEVLQNFSTFKMLETTCPTTLCHFQKTSASSLL